MDDETARKAGTSSGVLEETARGKHAATPFVALGGTALVIAAVVAVVVVIAALAYLLS